MTNAPSRWLVAALVAPIRWYQRLISPMRPATCRFYPSCSAYAVRALEIHGPFVGAWLAIRRIGRCHPWTPGGVDHVPPRGEWRTTRPPYDPGSSSDDAAETDPSATEFRAADGDATRARGANPRPSSLAPTSRPSFGRSTSLISIATPRRQGA